MQTIINIQRAEKNNFDAICQLLAEGKLPTEDINSLLENFFISTEENQVTGVMGMDRYGNAGLLRSAMVKETHRNTGIATALVNQLFDAARQQGVTVLYLITNTAETYFEKKGFKKISRDEVPATVLQSKEFNGLCPASSVIMFRQL